MNQQPLDVYLICGAGERRQRLLAALNYAGRSTLIFDSVTNFIMSVDGLEAGTVMFCISEYDDIQEEQLRQIESHCVMPIIAALPTLDEHMVVSMLDAGADDCIASDTSVAVVKAKLDALWLRFTRCGIPLLKVDRYVLDAQRCSISIDGERIKLNSKSYQLAALMLRNIEVFVSRQDIAHEIWHKEILKSRTLDVHTCGLRSTLRWDGQCGLKLKAVYGKGLLLHRTKEEAVLSESKEN